MSSFCVKSSAVSTFLHHLRQVTYHRHIRHYQFSLHWHKIIPQPIPLFPVRTTGLPWSTTTLLLVLLRCVHANILILKPRSFLVFPNRIQSVIFCIKLLLVVFLVRKERKADSMNGNHKISIVTLRLIDLWNTWRQIGEEPVLSPYWIQWAFDRSIITKQSRWDFSCFKILELPQIKKLIFLIYQTL